MTTSGLSDITALFDVVLQTNIKIFQYIRSLLQSRRLQKLFLIVDCNISRKQTKRVHPNIVLLF